MNEILRTNSQHGSLSSEMSYEYSQPKLKFLLSVDLGVKTGLAMYSSQGRLIWYRSQNFGNKVRLKKGIPGILNPDDGIDYVVIEGGGPLRKIWDAHLDRKNIEVMHIMAEDWRSDLLFEREQRSGKKAKEKALQYAERVIEKCSDKKIIPLNVNAAEAILIGLWAMKKLGWIERPSDIFR